MDVKEAVKIAIKYISEIFEGENISNVCLEEVNYNEQEKIWEITIGFSRIWKYPEGIMENFQIPSTKRQYKIVSIDENKKAVKSVKIREVMNV